MFVTSISNDMKSYLLFLSLFFFALLGTILHVNLFYGADFVFGSIAVLLILYSFGTVQGVVTAAFSSLCTYFLWGHPYAIFIYTLEAAFVGLLLKPGRKSLLLYDGLFWLFLGMPLVWFSYFVLMHVDFSETLFIGLMQGVNGITNALIASFLMTSLPIQLQRASPDESKYHLHETLFSLMVAAVIIPAVIVTIVNSREEKQRIEFEAVSRLKERTRDFVAYLRSWHHLHHEAMEGLGREAALSNMLPSDNLERYLEIILAAYPDIRAFNLADSTGSVMEVYPPVAERGEPRIGLHFSDQADQEELLKRKGPSLSQVFLGKGVEYIPLVTLSIPVYDDETLLGYVLGAFNLSRIQDYLSFKDERMLPEISLVDARYRILASSSPSKKPKEIFNPSETGTLKPVDQTVQQWMPEGRQVPAVKGWTDTRFVQETPVSSEVPWKVIAEIPLAPQQRHLFNRYVQNFAVMVILSVLAFPLALLLSRPIVKPIEVLAEVTTNLPEKLLEQTGIQWPESGNAEIHSLVANFQIMAVALEQQLQQLKEHSRELEQINQQLKTKIIESAKVEEALRESEERYREMSDLLPQPVFEMNMNGVFTFVNQAALDAFGYTKEEVTHELNASRLVVADDPRQARVDIGRYLMRQKTAGIEYTLRRKDGTTFPAIVYSSPVTRGGELAGVRGIVLDLTEQKKAEAELVTRQKLESLGVLAGGIAHDYNNILTGILGNISLAKMFASPEDRIIKRLEQAELAALRAKTLTQQLLTFARGGTPIKRTVSVASLLEESVKFALRGSNVRCEFEIAPGLSAADIDEGQISQAIHNIVINAVQAMPEGGVLRVTARNHFFHDVEGLPLEAGSYVQISIRDEGYGIPKEHLSRIFDPYFTTKQEGSGLGLATAYSIIRKHGGVITADSELGVETTFVIYIPASEKEVALLPETILSLPDGPYRILIMDDEEVVREVVGEMLEQMGYEVAFATDGAEAIETYRHAMEQNRPFDAVIMDLTIPGGMGGREAILKLLEIDPDIKAIVSSGYSGDVVMSHHESFGFKGVVPKPFKMAELSRVLRDVITQGDGSALKSDFGK